MSNYNQGLLDAYEACQGVRESGCESAQGASECCTAIRDLINSTPPVLAAPANSAVLTDAEIIEIATATRTAESNKDGGYILPISFARAILARSAPNADLVEALKQMVSWFGRYPEFVPVPEATDNIKASIKSARAALAAAGEA